MSGRAISGIVLAAGGSTRPGFCKALATVGDETLVARVIRVLREGGCAAVLVVVGPPHGDRVAAAVAGAEVVRNPDPSRGMLSSLKVALRAESVGRSAATVVALVDHPLVEGSTVAALIAGFRASAPRLVQPRHAGKLGHPFLVDAALRERLLESPDTEGARPVLRAAAPRLEVDVDDAHILTDLDTEAALAAAGATPPRN